MTTPQQENMTADINGVDKGSVKMWWTAFRFLERLSTVWQ